MHSQKTSKKHKCVDAKSGRFVAGVMRGESLDNSVVLIHALQVQFSIDILDKESQPVSRPVNCALATLEMTETGARKLHEMLGGLLGLSPVKQ